MFNTKRFFLTALTVIAMLLTLTMCVSADYTTDNDPQTAVDYIIMHADDIKLASGTKGEVKYDENKYKIVSYKPSESHSADENHRLFIKPESSNAGFAASGENSFFDFSYYVVYYKTSSTANAKLDVNFYNGSIYKFPGTHDVTSSTTYKAAIIEKETFTNGNTASHTTAPESSWTNQQMSFKAFPNGDVTGTFDIEAIAAFRTKAQAELFVNNYEPKEHKDSLDHLVINSFDLLEASSSTVFKKTSEFDNEAVKGYVKFTSTLNEAHQDGSAFIFNFGDLTSDITVKDYPIIKVSYKSKITDANTKLDVNVGLGYLGTDTSVWGPKPTFTRNETVSSIIFNMQGTSFNGGSGLTGYSFDSIDDDSTYNYLRLKPYWNGSMAVDDYFAVEYIGFFKTVEDANAYTLTLDRTLQDITPAFGVYKLKTGNTFKNTIAFSPFYADVKEYTHMSSNTDVATIDENGLITAVAPGTATITYKDTYTGVSATTTIVVEAQNSPLDWYAKDSAEGEKVTLYVLGDSISAGVGTSDKTNTYHGRWAKAFKMDVNNWSRGGSAVTGNYLYDGEYIETFVPHMERMIAHDVKATDVVTTENDPDMIVIYGGTNDYNGSWTLGEVGDTTRNTYCGAISELISLAWNNYPNAKLVFFTPIKRCDFSTTDDNSGMRRYELDAYVDAMKEVCALYDVPCIDLYNNEQVNLIGLRSTYINDGVHMTEEGHRIFAKVTIEEMEKAGVIKTHGYTPEPAATYTLDTNRDLTADSHVFTAAQLNTLATYNTSSLLERSRMTKHTLTDDGFIKFSAETLTSKIAPTITVNLSKLGFAVTDYSYMSVVYKTDSTCKNIGTTLRGADNHISAVETAPALVSGRKAAFTVDIKSYSSDDIVLTGNTLPKDLYFTLSFFDSTKDMTSDSYVAIESIAFFKTKEAADAYNAANAPAAKYGDINGDGDINSEDTAVFSRSIANWAGYTTMVVEENADLNSSGTIDAADGIILSRHIAEWSGYATLPIAGSSEAQG